MNIKNYLIAFVFFISGSLVLFNQLPINQEKIRLVKQYPSYLLYKIKAIARLKQAATPFPVLEFYSTPHPQSKSPINKMHERLDEDPTTPIERHQIERDPEAIIGYPVRFCNTLGERISISYAGDLLCKGKYITSVNIYNALNNNIIDTRKLEEGTAPLVREKCHSFYRGGCKFSNRIEFPAALLGVGEYYLILKNDADQESHPIYFNVRPELSSTAVLPKVVVMFPNHTWAAYNYEGGGSLYGILALIDSKCERYYLPDRLYSASLDRPIIYHPENKNFRSKQSLMEPLAPPSLFHHAPESSIVFLRLLRLANIPYITTSNTDLHLHPEILDHAEVLIFTGHDEYWTQNMRETVDRYIKKGGHVANFSGDISWWRINLINNDLYQDQLSGIRDRFPNIPYNFSGTGLWNASTINYPGEITFGISYAYAGYPIQEYMSKDTASKEYNIDESAYEKSGNITVLDETHPAFEETGLKNGSQWGNKSKVLSVELDGIPLDEANAVDPFFLPLKPYKMPKVLASATSFAANSYSKDSKTYYGVKKVGIFVEYTPAENAGTVLSFGSIGYCVSLYMKDPIAEKIFLNSINYLLSLNAQKRNNIK